MRIRYFLWILLFSPIWGVVDKEYIARHQFPHGRVSQHLKDNVPFLNQPFDRMNTSTISPNNIHTAIFQPHENQFQVFSALTGRSIYDTQFVISWYMFQDADQIPASNNKLMSLLNTTKPLDFSILTYTDNNQWIAKTNLPYKGNQAYVYAYISIVNKNGVLLPLAGQSFYENKLNHTNIKENSFSFNTDILLYWEKQGYL